VSLSCSRRFRASPREGAASSSRSAVSGVSSSSESAAYEEAWVWRLPERALGSQDAASQTGPGYPSGCSGPDLWRRDGQRQDLEKGRTPHANVPELPYCSAFGETYEEALLEARVAMDLYLATVREEGIVAPKLSRRHTPAAELRYHRSSERRRSRRS